MRMDKTAEFLKVAEVVYYSRLPTTVKRCAPVCGGVVTGVWGRGYRCVGMITSNI